MSPTSAGAFRQDLDDKAALMGLLQHCRVFVFPSTAEAMSMMLLDELALGAVGIAGDIPENTSILPTGYPTYTAVQRAGQRCRGSRQAATKSSTAGRPVGRSEVVSGQPRQTEKVAQQAGLERPVAMNRHRKPDGTAVLAVDVVAAVNAKQQPAVSLERLGQVTVARRFIWRCP